MSDLPTGQPAPQPDPGPLGQPSQPAVQPHPGEPHAPGTRRIKRRLVVGLLGLYLVSILAAVGVVFRNPVLRGTAKGGEGQDAGLLSLAPKETVGWVSIHGAIYAQGSRRWDKGAYQYARRIRMMAESKGVKAIVLDINSPGGSVGAVQELYSQIRRVRSEHDIPIVALFGDVAASGGYYIAAACDKIVAHPGTLTGSIGVIFNVSNAEELFKKIGYKSDPIKSGRHKDIGSWSRPMTPEEHRILQELIDTAYGQFLEAISTGRNMSIEKLKPLADGRIFAGSQALENGLVDMIGDSDDAVELAGKLGGITGKPKIKREADPQRMLMELFETRFGALWAPSSWLAGLDRPGGLEYLWTGW